MPEGHRPPAQAAAICTIPRPLLAWATANAERASARASNVRLATSAGAGWRLSREGARCPPVDEPLAWPAGRDNALRTGHTRRDDPSNRRLSGRHDGGHAGRRAPSPARHRNATDVRSECGRRAADARRSSRRRRSSATWSRPGRPERRTCRGTRGRSRGRLSSASHRRPPSPAGKSAGTAPAPRDRAVRRDDDPRPATGTHGLRPRHSFVAAAGGAGAQRGSREQGEQHGERSRHPPEPERRERAAAEQHSAPPPAKKSVISRDTSLVAEPRPRLVVDLRSRLSVAAVKNSPPVVLRDQLQRLRARRHADRLGVSARELVLHDAGRRAEQDRVDGTCRRLRLLRSRPGVVRPPSRAPSEISRTDVGGDDPSFACCRWPELCREQHRVADRCALARAQRPDRRRARGRGRPSARRAICARVANETTPIRNFFGTVDEWCAAALRGGEPRRLDVGRAHRPRDVDREQDGRLLAGHADRRMRPRDADDQRRERDEQERDRHVPARTGRAVDQIRQQRRASSSAAANALAAPLAETYSADEHGDREQPEQRREPKLIRPPQESARAGAASPRRSSARRAARRAPPARARPRAARRRPPRRTARRSRALRVSTRRCRPVSGSTSHSSPAFASSSSRGSRTSTAITS